MSNPSRVVQDAPRSAPAPVARPNTRRRTVLWVVLAVAVAVNVLASFDSALIAVTAVSGAVLALSATALIVLHVRKR